MSDPISFNTQVKLQIYQTVAESGKVPASSEVALAVGKSVEEVEAAFEDLTQKRLLVLEPGSRGNIRMAPPFSGIETPFRVVVQNQTYFANCVWDALGVPAALQQDGEVFTADAQTGVAMSVAVRDGRPVPEPCAIHFAVPASQWWDDIIYT